MLGKLFAPYVTTSRGYMLPELCQEGDSFAERNSTKLAQATRPRTPQREEWWPGQPHGLKSVDMGVPRIKLQGFSDVTHTFPC